MFGHYILTKDKLAVPVDMWEWAEWFENSSRAGTRHVAIELIGETYLVSTVFLGLDHAFGGDPLLFETMIFIEAEWGWHENMGYRFRDSLNWCDRCGTWEEALDMHERAVVHAKGLLRLLPVVVEER